jgi:hypothetical protein
VDRTEGHSVDQKVDRTEGRLEGRMEGHWAGLRADRLGDRMEGHWAGHLEEASQVVLALVLLEPAAW